MSALSASGMGAARTSASSVYLELKKYQLHNSPEGQATRLTTFLSSGYAPAIGRAGAKLVGAFNNYIGPEGPSVITLTQYDSLGALEAAIGKLRSDSEYQSALEKLEQGTGYPYQREESSILKTFAGFPRPVLSESSDHHPPRILELRCYESHTEVTLARKVKMFNEGEIGVFERLGMRPVFFGETIVGPKMPNLVYMLSFDDLTSREALWKKFGSDPEWKKISSPAELHDDKVVSNISNSFLKPLTFSLIR